MCAYFMAVYVRQNVGLNTFCACEVRNNISQVRDKRHCKILFQRNSTCAPAYTTKLYLWYITISYQLCTDSYGLTVMRYQYLNTSLTW